MAALLHPPLEPTPGRRRPRLCRHEFAIPPAGRLPCWRVGRSHSQPRPWQPSTTLARMKRRRRLAGSARAVVLAWALLAQAALGAAGGGHRSGSASDDSGGLPALVVACLRALSSPARC